MCQCVRGPDSGWDELKRACIGRTSGPVTSSGMTARKLPLSNASARRGWRKLSKAPLSNARARLRVA